MSLEPEALALRLGAVLGEIDRLLQAAAPEEGCGVVLQGPQGTLKAVGLNNVSPRRRTAFELDALALARLLSQARTAGEELCCIFHSHVGAGAVFSNEDRQMAAPSALGAPLWPGVAWLVVEISGGWAVDHKMFVWKSGDFREVEIKIV